MAYTQANITRNELRNVSIPAPTATWQPIHHSFLVNETIAQLHMRGQDIIEEKHEIAAEGLRYFGQFKIAGDTPEYSWMLGLRNANDKRFGACGAFGEQVTVCSNLMFAGEEQFGRKHTLNIMNDLPGLISNCLDNWTEAKVVQNDRRETFKTTKITDRLMPQILVRSMEDGIISSSQIGKVWAEWKTPTHEDFAERTLWSAQNAFTEVLKEVNQMTMPTRTIKLTNLMDRVAAAA